MDLDAHATGIFREACRGSTDRKRMLRGNGECSIPAEEPTPTNTPSRTIPIPKGRDRSTHDQESTWLHYSTEKVRKMGNTGQGYNTDQNN